MDKKEEFDEKIEKFFCLLCMGDTVELEILME
jgi:hypothetical protein